MALPRVRNPFAPCLCFTLLLLAAPSVWGQEAAAEPAELSDEQKLAALEEQAALKATEEEQARLLAEEEAVKFAAEQAKMKALEDEAAQTHADAERLVKEAAEEEEKMKAAQAHLKNLEYEAGKKAVEEQVAKKAAAAEEAAFKSEKAKMQALAGTAARKEAEMKAIQQEEEKLIAQMNEKSAGADMTAEVSKATTGRVLSSEVPAGAGTGDIFTKLENAKAAGVDAKDYAAVAAKAHKQASEELKSAASATHHDTRRLRTAFINAEKAGVHEKDSAAAQSTAADTAGKRLAKAHAAINITTSANIEELAQAIRVGQSVGLDQKVLDAAKQAYERQAVHTWQSKDLRHAETFVKNANNAGAQIPNALIQWKKMMERLKAARTITEETPHTLNTLLEMMTEAKAMNLPNNTDLATVETRVQAWSHGQLKNSLSKAVNMTQAEFAELLAKVETANKAGISSPDVTKAREQVISRARSRLDTVVNMQPKSFDAGELKGAFADADAAGVPEADRTAARNKVIAGIQTRLTSLTSASSNSSNTRSTEFVAELAHAIALAGRFDMVDAASKARSFYSKQCETALSESHLSYAEALVKFASPVGVDPGATLKSWVKMWKRLKEARTTPDDRKDLLPSLLSTVMEAKAIGLPNSSDFASVASKVQTWAAADLKEASSKSGGNNTSDDSFARLLAALEQAKSAGVTSAELQAVDSKVHLWASSELTKACTTKPYDASHIKTATMSAERAGVSEAIRTKALADLQADIEKQLIAVTSKNVSKMNRNADFVEELAQAMHMGRRVAINETLKSNARTFYEEQGKLALKEHDFHYAELLVKSSSKAGAEVPPQLITWVKMLKQLAQAEKTPVERTDQLPTLLGLIASAKAIGGLDTNKHLAAVEATAKQMARADLKSEL